MELDEVNNQRKEIHEARETLVRVRYDRLIYSGSFSVCSVLTVLSGESGLPQ